MILPTSRILLAGMLLSMPPLGAECLKVRESWIRGADLVAWIAEEGPEVLEARLARAPVPGVQRVAPYEEWARWVRLAGLTPRPIAVPHCFERRTRTVPPSEWNQAIQDALEQWKGLAAGWQFNLLSAGPLELPSGTLVFERAGLSRQPGSDTRHYWRGRLMDGGEKSSLPVWAVVELKVPRKQWIVQRPLDPGQVLEAPDFLVREEFASPLTPDVWKDRPSPPGAQVRRALPAGHTLTPRDLVPRKLLARGEEVVFSARSGAAEVRSTGTIEVPANAGDRTWVRNHSTRKRVPARVDAHGRVSALASNNPNQR